MGLLRMLLAFSVLTAHMQGKNILGFRLIYGNLAVQCFFMISGFYMALVLNEKYFRPGDYMPFLRQRVLRLFPACFFVLILMLVIEGIVSLAAGKPLETYAIWFQHAADFSWSTWLVMIFSNVFVVGQEVNLFQAVDPVTGNLYFIRHFFDAPIPATSLIFNGPSWTLALEMMFYVIAPFIVRWSAWPQILVCLASVGLRIGTYWMIDPTENSWHMVHFFPYELAFFMAGSIGYQIYRHKKALLKSLEGFTHWFRWVFFALIIAYSRLPGGAYLRESILVPALFLMIPLLFFHTKNNPRDRLIGELSYPFYLVHSLILFTMRPWVPHYFPSVFVGPLYAIMSVGSAYLIYRFIDEKIDNYRHRLFERTRAESPPAEMVPAK
ncbi:MAG: acyltransferase [Methylacidiphilales bacterium]|nr:acyltransferase [Candidatus Methylacidiphilales bacterium]